MPGACGALRRGRGDARARDAARQQGSDLVDRLLGETRIAEGKLDEAIAALTAASELDYQQNNATLHWLLAAAYDRARMPNQVAEHLTAGYRNDRYFSMIKNLMPQSGGPYLGEDEPDYLLGLAWGVQPDAYAGAARPELQLAYFRRYLVRAPHSQWRRRAEEHVKELRAVDYPEAIERRYSAPLGPRRSEEGDQEGDAGDARVHRREQRCRAEGDGHAHGAALAAAGVSHDERSVRGSRADAAGDRGGGAGDEHHPGRAVRAGRAARRDRRGHPLHRAARR